MDGIVAGGERREQSGVVAAVGERAEAGGDGGVGDGGIRGGSAPVVVGRNLSRSTEKRDRGIRERPGQTDGGECRPEAADEDALAGAGGDHKADGGGGSGGHGGLEVEVGEPRGERDRVGVVNFEQGRAGGAGDPVDAGGVGAGGQGDDEGGIFGVVGERERACGGGGRDQRGGGRGGAPVIVFRDALSEPVEYHEGRIGDGAGHIVGSGGQGRADRADQHGLGGTALDGEARGHGASAGRSDRAERGEVDEGTLGRGGHQRGQTATKQGEEEATKEHGKSKTG